MALEARGHRALAIATTAAESIAAVARHQPDACLLDLRFNNGEDGLAAATLPTFTAVAAADGVGGRRTFKATQAVRGRYVLIWFTRLPPVSPARYEAEIFNAVFRGWR